MLTEINEFEFNNILQNVTDTLYLLVFCTCTLFLCEIHQLVITVAINANNFVCFCNFVVKQRSVIFLNPAVRPGLATVGLRIDVL